MWTLELVLADGTIVAGGDVEIIASMYGDGVRHDIRSDSTHFVDLLMLADAVRPLLNTLYVGAFRSAIGASGSAYYDLSVGSSFISAFANAKSGPSWSENEAITAMSRRIAGLLGFSSLEVNASPGNGELTYTVDDWSLRGSELGAGVAQFVVVTASVLLKRPEFLLIDEPEMNLHASLQQDFLTMLASYTGSGVIFSTHSLGLARTTADRIVVCQRTDGGVTASLMERSTRLSLALGELGYGGIPDENHAAVLLVEGPTEIRVLHLFLGLYGVRGEVVIVSLGGSDYISAGKDYGLEELSRLAPQVFALVDSERDSENDPVPKNRQQFLDTCAAASIDCHILSRRALENYLDQAIAGEVLRPAKAEPFGHFDKPPASWSWSKEKNWRVAERMPRSSLDDTDLGDFLARLAAAVGVSAAVER